MIPYSDGLDVVSYSLDVDESPHSVRILRSLCGGEPIIKPRYKPYHPQQRLVVELHQPSYDALCQVVTDLAGAAMASLDYVEVARDFHVATFEEALAQHCQLLRTITLPHHRGLVRIDPEHPCIYYWRERQERGTNLVLYSDKLSKILGTDPDALGTPCAHLEMRLAGAAAIAQHGIASLEDLIALDFAKFWTEWVRWHLMPKVTKLGEFLVGPERASRISKTRQRAVANDFLQADANVVQGQFVLQNALLSHPRLADHLTRVTPVEWAAAMARKSV